MLIDQTYLRGSADAGGLPKRKFPRADAIAVARELMQYVAPYCERFVIAGSLRRRKQKVGDVEIVYIPKFVAGRPSDLFKDPEPVDCVAARLDYLIEERGILASRLNREDNATWGPKNKLALHVASGIPVDMFATTAAAWWNYLVCRTGSSESNIRIAAGAKAKGWKWNPYGVGFTDNNGIIIQVDSERAVFDLVGLPYMEPWQR